MTKKKNPEDKLKPGAKEVITPEIRDRILTLYRMGLKDDDVCDNLDITPSVLYAYQKRHPEFAEKKRLAKGHLLARARKEIFMGLTSDDPKIRIDTAKWVAERLAKKEFSTRQEVTGEDGAPIVPQIEILPVAVMDKTGEDMN